VKQGSSATPSCAQPEQAPSHRFAASRAEDLRIETMLYASGWRTMALRWSPASPIRSAFGRRPIRKSPGILAFLQDRVAFRRYLRGSGSEASAPPRRRCRKGWCNRRRPSPENSLARGTWGVFWASTCRQPKPQIVFFAAARSPRSPARSPRCGRAGACGSTCGPGCCSGSGSSRQRRAGGAPGRLRGFLARLADERVLPPGERSRCRSFGCFRLVLAGWLRIGEAP